MLGLPVSSETFIVFDMPYHKIMVLMHFDKTDKTTNQKRQLHFSMLVGKIKATSMVLVSSLYSVIKANIHFHRSKYTIPKSDA